MNVRKVLAPGQRSWCATARHASYLPHARDPPGTRSRGGPRPDHVKERHCGQTGSARTNIQTYRPGSPLHLVWDEYVVHPGWFRVSFPQNGDTFEIPPVSTGPTGAAPRRTTRPRT